MKYVIQVSGGAFGSHKSYVHTYRDTYSCVDDIEQATSFNDENDCYNFLNDIKQLIGEESTGSRYLPKPYKEVTYIKRELA